MADSKVSELVAATSVGGSDLLYLVQSNTSKKITAANFFANVSNVTLSGNVNFGGTPQLLSAPGIVSLTTPITHLASDAVGGAVQIPLGTQGQVKLITMISTSGGAYTLATANVAGGVTLTFNSVGDSALLLYSNNKWNVIGTSAGSAAVTSVNGLLGDVVLTTANVAESGNVYFTNARAYANAVQAGFITSAALNGYATNAQLSGFVTAPQLTTANVAEVGNQYFTNARAVAAIESTNTITVGNVIPNGNSVFDLGSPTNQWKSLYVSNSTIYIGGVALSIQNNELVIGEGGSSANLATVSYVNSALANVGGTDTGNISFANSTISANNENQINLEAKDSSGFATTRLSLEPVYSTAQLSAYSSETTQTFTLANGDFASGVWQDNGFGNGIVSFTGAQSIGDFFQNTLLGLTPENVTITINNEPPSFLWNGGVSGSGTDAPGFGTNPIVPQLPIPITSIQFVYRSQSFINVNYNNQEIRLKAQNAGIEFDATSDIRMFGDQTIEMQSGTDFTISSGQNINLSTGSSDSIGLSTGDFNVNAFDDIRIEGRDSFRLINSSNIAPIRIITDDDNNSYTWAFGANGNLALPGNLIFTANSTINSVPNSSGDGIGASTLQLVPDTNLFGNDQYLIVDPTEPDHIHIRGGGEIDNCSAKLIFGGENSHFAVQAGANSTVSVRANSYNWNFNTDGTFSTPGSITTDGIISTGKSKFDKVIESYSGIDNPTGNVTFDCTSAHVFNVTGINTNFTVNLTNLDLNDGEATSITLVLNQGSSAYIANSLQIGGVTQTIKWQGNAVPTGNVNAIDIESFSILYVSGNYIVLGQLTTFG